MCSPDLFLSKRRSHSNHIPQLFGDAHQILGSRAGIQTVIEEHAVAPLTRLLLKGSAIRLPNPP
jgi:hypothetical protein